MSHPTDRRTFLQTSAAIAASSATLRAQDAAKTEVKANPVLTKRPLGKTGVDITMLDQGAVRGSGYDRILRLSYQSGVRTFDTAKVYGTEPNLKKWFEAQPEVRKEIFLAKHFTTNLYQIVGFMVVNANENHPIISHEVSC